MGADEVRSAAPATGERSPERVDIRHCYRVGGLGYTGRQGRARDPEAEAGVYFLTGSWQPRRRAEQAFVTVIADAYLAERLPPGEWELVQQLGSSG
jgi:hypothetical protein